MLNLMALAFSSQSALCEGVKVCVCVGGGYHGGQAGLLHYLMFVLQAALILTGESVTYSR